MHTSYGTKVLYSRDHKGVGVVHVRHHQKPASLFPDDDEAVLIRQKILQIDPKRFQQVAMKLFKN